MLYHLSFALLILVGYYFFTASHSCDERGRVNYINYSTVVLILQSALRNVAVGPDTYAYYLYFEKITSTPWSKIFASFYTVYVSGIGKDAGYPLLEKIFQIAFPDYRIFLFFVAIVFFLAIRTLLIRYTGSTTEVLFSILLYWALFYTFFSITGIRQTLAVAISIYALPFIQRRKIVPMAILSLIAFTIHKSAIIMPFLYFLYKLRNMKTIATVSILGFIVFLAGREYFVNIVREAAGYDRFESPLPLKLMIFYFVFSIIIFKAVRRTEEEDDIRGIFSLYIPTFMWIPVLGNDSLFMREVLYVSPYIIPLLPFTLSQYKGDLPFLVKSALFFLLLFLYLQNGGEYKFAWEEMRLPENYFR